MQENYKAKIYNVFITTYTTFLGGQNYSFGYALAGVCKFMYDVK